MLLFKNKPWKYILLGILIIYIVACSPLQSEQSLNGQETRTIQHAMGETEVPQNPKRVVVLDSSAVENAIALDAQLIGGATSENILVDNESSFSPEIKSKARQLTNVGHQTNPSLETILSLDPDLILGNKNWQEEIYSKLSQIAPTVFTEGTGPHWKENLPKQAEALGKSDRGKQLMDEYYQRLNLFQEKMGEQLKQTKVAVVQFRPDIFRFYMKDSFFGLILEDAGLPRPPVQDKNESYENVSFEMIPTLNEADVILFMEDKESIKERVTSHPLWSKLKAVREGRVYELSEYGTGILSAHLMIDDLFKYLIDSDDISLYEDLESPFKPLEIGTFNVSSGQ